MALPIVLSIIVRYPALICVCVAVVFLNWYLEAMLAAMVLSPDAAIIRRFVILIRARSTSVAVNTGLRLV